MSDASNLPASVEADSDNQSTPAGMVRDLEEKAAEKVPRPITTKPLNPPIEIGIWPDDAATQPPLSCRWGLTPAECV